MPDQLTDDQLERMFSDLRVQAIPAILAPGPDSAQRTVRRRRHTTTTATVLGVLVLAGLAVAVGRPIATGHSTADALTAAAPTPGPRLGDDALQELTVRAEGALLSGTGSLGAVIDSAAVLYRGSFAIVRTVVAAPTVPAPAGSYAVQFTCAGYGKLGITISSVPPKGDGGADLARTQVIGEGQVMCDAEAPPYSISAVQPTAGWLMVTPKADPDALGRAAFAYLIERLPTPSAESTRNAAAAGAALAAAATGRTATTKHTTENGEIGLRSGGSEPLTGPIRVACAGPGSLHVRVQIDDDVMVEGTARCGRPPRLAEYPIHTSPYGSTPPGEIARSRIMVWVRPDAAAANRAGYSVLVPG